MWTIDELVERVRLALAARYPGAPNGRVRDLPDQRAIRWYATRGLVDRPVMRGRTALYDKRHLLQLVAIKRRQAEGRTLAEIQVELTGATDSTLGAIARMPEHLSVDGDRPAAEPTRPRFWAAPRPPAPLPPAPLPPAPLPPAPLPPVPQPPPPPQPTAAAPPPPAPAAVPGAAAPPAGAAPLAAVALGGGTVLLLPGQPAADDYAAIAAAARPLLHLLATRGLLTGTAPTPAPLHHRAPHTDRSSS